MRVIGAAWCRGYCAQIRNWQARVLRDGASHEAIARKFLIRFKAAPRDRRTYLHIAFEEVSHLPDMHLEMPDAEEPAQPDAAAILRR